MQTFWLAQVWPCVRTWAECSKSTIPVNKLSKDFSFLAISSFKVIRIGLTPSTRVLYRGEQETPGIWKFLLPNGFIWKQSTMSGYIKDAQQLVDVSLGINFLKIQTLECLSMNVCVFEGNGCSMKSLSFEI
ncbi:hypothetical protein Nepgr_002000 [Nepenthes gracilis]|uniref:Uncharacterized protein n=1 Tax=Nepenthes gracilis TaxID=150966 RepID=A0AAD3P5H9_NEPGR|nr:hypothetical protein Nepgr_002000 [Nepenthes gracilis]